MRMWQGTPGHACLNSTAERERPNQALHLSRAAFRVCTSRSHGLPRQVIFIRPPKSDRMNEPTKRGLPSLSRLGRAVHELEKVSAQAEQTNGTGKRRKKNWCEIGRASCRE